MTIICVLVRLESRLSFPFSNVRWCYEGLYNFFWHLCIFFLFILACIKFSGCISLCHYWGKMPTKTTLGRKDFFVVVVHGGSSM